jgi:hypothetical protein
VVRYSAMSTSLNGVDQVGSVTSKNELELTAMELMETKGAALVCVPGGINTLPNLPEQIKVNNQRRSLSRRAVDPPVASSFPQWAFHAGWAARLSSLWKRPRLWPWTSPGGIPPRV